MNQDRGKWMAELDRRLGLLVALSCLAGCMAASPRAALEKQPCGSWVVCTPEDALIASIAVLRTNGDSLLLDCGVKHLHSEALAQSCLERVRKVVERFTTAGSGIEPIAPEVLRVEVGETCLDTFVPGNEASDCAFYSYTVKLPLIWQ